MHYTREEVKWDSEPDVTIYFSDTSGRTFTRRELTCSNRRHRDAPIPDIGMPMLPSRYELSSASSYDSATGMRC